MRGKRGMIGGTCELMASIPLALAGRGRVGEAHLAHSGAVSRSRPGVLGGKNREQEVHSRMTQKISPFASWAGFECTPRLKETPCGCSAGRTCRFVTFRGRVNHGTEQAKARIRKAKGRQEEGNQEEGLQEEVQEEDNEEEEGQQEDPQQQADARRRARQEPGEAPGSPLSLSAIRRLRQEGVFRQGFTPKSN